MKKLPDLYKSAINKSIHNNKEVCYLKNVEEKPKESIEKTINQIFNGIGYSYNIPVTIVTDLKVYNTSLIAKIRNNVVTLDNEVINIDDIRNIEIKR